MLTNAEILKIVKRLQEARLSLMRNNPFFAVLLLHMQFSIDEMCETAYTDGKRIVFCPDFMNTLSEKELEFVLMHEVMHVALNHCGRTHDTYDFDDFNVACDIVVNSNILYANHMDLSTITLQKYGESMHMAPNGEEGYLHTAEDVYRMIRDGKVKLNTKSKKKGTIPAQATIAARGDGGFDDHTYWGDLEEGDGDKKNSGEGSNAPNAEQENEYNEDGMREVWLQRMIEATTIANQIADYKAEKGQKGCGAVPLAAKRIVDEFTKPQTDWRTVLDTFIQEEITDYSFNPPDRRFSDSPFLLPDFNEKDESVKDILFMIDTSGSMSTQDITQAYSEIKGAIDQFDGHLAGWLGFFDAVVVEPQAFTDEEEFKIIRPEGGGGTSFQCIFDYVKEHNNENDFNPASIIILTDGCAPFPDESATMDIPVLWIINNENVTPPWGKVTRIKPE